MNLPVQRLRLIRAGIDTYQQAVVYVHRDCDVCRAEGFTAFTRVLIHYDGTTLPATLNVVTDGHWPRDAAALSEAAWAALAPADGATAWFSHAEPSPSAGILRAKVFGNRLTADDYLQLMRDTVAGAMSDLELAAFVTACAGDRLDQGETDALARAMVDVGQRLDWGSGPVYDKHCVGGLPGNRTTPIVVAIAAAAGLRIPKTSSRAITSPAGTADMMEVLTDVALELPDMRRVVEREGGCIVWGGSVRLSPADDILIRIERPLDFDSDGQLVASVLSKKAAAGSTHVLIDVPVGPTAKVRSLAAAEALRARLIGTAQALGLTLSIVSTDGRQPVGHGIGPALEARDVVQVLRGDTGAPHDLRERALDLAGLLLDLRGTTGGRAEAARLLGDGTAWKKFRAICEAQGRFSEQPTAEFVYPFASAQSGRIRAIDNRRLARVAKLAGAPACAVAGVDCRLRIGDRVERGQPLFHIHAASSGQLDYALAFAAESADLFTLEDA